MHKTVIIICFSVILFFSGCAEKPEKLKVEVLNQTFFPELPSASGIVSLRGSTYLVGDDSPWLFLLNEKNEISDKIKLSPIDPGENNRVPKNLKADFEAMEKLSIDGVEHLMVISSGSSEVSRDTAYLISVNTEWTIKKRNLRPLYETLKQTANISGKDEINLEGIAIHLKKTYLFHRGNVSGNFIAVLDTDQFVNYVSKSSNQIPEVEIIPFDLPVYKNQKSGFSGACISPDGINIVFTASLEETNDVVNDGRVLGSYVGLIGLDNLSDGEYEAVLIKRDGKTLEQKLEGISIKSSSKNKMNALVVCDNDDGTSDLFEMEIYY